MITQEVHLVFVTDDNPNPTACFKFGSYPSTRSVGDICVELIEWSGPPGQREPPTLYRNMPDGSWALMQPTRWRVEKRRNPKNGAETSAWIHIGECHTLQACKTKERGIEIIGVVWKV
jgi:hypothetical protein